jgi:hypothetical protein
LEFCWMSTPEYLQYAEVSAILKNRSVATVAKPVVVADADEDAGDEEEVEAVKPKSTAKLVSKPQSAVPSKPAKAAKSASEIVDEFEDEIDEDELEDEDGGEEEIVGKGKPASKQGGKPKVSKDEFEDDDADEEDSFDEDDFDDEASSKTSKAGKVSGGSKEDEDSEESDDFDDEADNSGLQEELEEQLNQSVSKANAIARSRNRTSPEPEVSKKPRRSN